MPTVIAPVATPQGSGRLLIDAAADPVATLVLGHGAGGGPNATDLELLARGMPEHGTTVVRFEQPWRTAGRRVATPPAKLDEAWLAAVEWLGEEALVRGPLFVGGRSAGARVACRTADVVGPAGIICLASAAPARSPREVQDRRAASAAGASACPARHGGRVRSSGRDPGGHRGGQRHPPSRAAWCRPQLPGGHVVLVHAGRPSCRPAD